MGIDEDEFSVAAKPKRTRHGQQDKKRLKNAEQSRELSHEKSSSDEFSFGKVKNVFANRKVLTVISIILLIAVAFGTSWYFRTRTVELSITKDWASSNVAAYYKNAIKAQVDQQYPNLPAASKAPIVESEYQKFYASNRAAIDANVAEAQKFFKQNLQDDHGLTYILNIDSFYFLKRAELIVNTGHYYNKLVDGVPYDTYMLAPKGLRTEPDFHSSFAAFLFKVMRFFSANASITLAAFYTPVILASLTVIPMFFIVRKYAGNFAGFFAALIIAIHPVFLGRTMGGDFDNDVYNILFPLLVAWIFIEIIEAKRLKNKLILTVVNGFLIGVFSFAWRGGWWYIFDFIIGVLLVFLWYKTLRKMIVHIVAKGWLKVSKAMAKVILFFGPIVLGILLFVIWNPLGLVFFFLYGLVIAGFFVKDLVRIIPAWRKKALSKDQEDVLSAVLVFVVFFLISLLFVSWFMGFSVFASGPLQPLRITTIQQAAKSNYWPNVYTTVAELNVADFSGIIGQVASFGSFGAKINLFFIIAAMGVILTLVKKRLDWRDVTLLIFSFALYLILMTPKALALPPMTYLSLFALPLLIGLYFLLDVEGHDIKYAVFLIIWFVATLYAGTKGIRFIHLMLPAFCVGLGIAVGKVYDALGGLATKTLSINKYVAKGVLGVLLLLLLINPLTAATAVSRSSVPIFDRTWYESMAVIKQDSRPDAIINSWWDFGHFFKDVADRRVTFDGAIQNTPPAHWIGETLSTKNEDRAMGILRMLDCSQNDAYDLLNENVGTVRAMGILEAILPLERENASAYLAAQGIPSGIASQVLDDTHCAPPEDYFITSGDMVGKAGVWAHFGYWDFTRSYIYVNIKGKGRDEAVAFMTKNLSMAQDKAEQYYTEVLGLTTDRAANSWISSWPGYVTSAPLGCTHLENRTVECRINLGIGQNAQTTTVIEKAVVDLDDLNNSYLQFGVYDKTLQAKLGGSVDKPHAFVTTGPDGFITTAFSSTVFPYDVVVDTYHNKMIIADPALSQSAFTKLFYFDGIYMEHFDKKFDRTGISGVNVKVWKVDWDGKAPEELDKMKAVWGIVPLVVNVSSATESGNATNAAAS